jgi:hypothetical protein
LGDKPEVGDELSGTGEQGMHYLTLISGIRETGFYHSRL